MAHSLLVAGFHRSGTSMTAQLLSRAGLELGDRLAGAHPSNPDGHFEDLDTVALHDEWLAANGCDWRCTSADLPQQPDSVRTRIESIAARIGSSEQPWGVKDPRICLFLETWFDVLSDSACVMVYRHWSECLDSLQRRAAQQLLREPRFEGPSFECWSQPLVFLEAWLAYNQALLSHRQRFPERCLLVSQAALLQGFDLPTTVNDVLQVALTNGTVSGVDAKLTVRSPSVLSCQVPAPLRQRLDQIWVELQQHADASDPHEHKWVAATDLPNAASGLARLESLWDSVGISATSSVVWPAPLNKTSKVETPEARLNRLREQRDAAPADAMRQGRFGCASAHAGDLDAAEQALRIALQSNPKHSGFWFHLGLVAKRRGQPAKAIEALKKAESLGANANQVFSLACLHQATGELSEAMAVAARGRAAYPEDVRFVLEAARWLANNAQPEAALASLEAASDNYTHQQLTNLHYALLSKLGRREEAKIVWHQHLRRELCAQPAYRQRVRALIEALGHNATREQLATQWCSELEALKTAQALPGRVAIEVSEDNGVRVAMSILVRDEADIIAANVHYHAAMGVQRFIVTDNGSVDGTRELLDTLAQSYQLEIIDEPSHTIDQDHWMTRMAHTIVDRGDTDWLIHNDADEFWVPRQSSIPEAIQTALAALGKHAKDVGVLSCSRQNILLGQETIEWPDYQFFDNVHAVQHSVPLLPGEQPWSSEDSNSVARTVQGKVITRVEGFSRIAFGNHGAEHSLQKAACSTIGIRHYPVRNYAQFERKVRNYGESLARNERLPTGLSRHLRYWYEQYLIGRLSEEFAQVTFSSERLNELTQKGYLAVDPALVNVLAPWSRAANLPA
jgi:tetratricopeptide (TPR) repeat protein